MAEGVVVVMVGCLSLGWCAGWVEIASVGSDGVWIESSELDDLDVQRGEVGEQAVQVRCVADQTGQSGGADLGRLDPEVVDDGAEHPVGGSTADLDLVAGRSGHVSMIGATGVERHHSPAHLTRVRWATALRGSVAADRGELVSYARVMADSSAALTATKVTPPRPPSRYLRRSRLTDALDASVDAGRGVVLVSAPAGSGKSTLVNGWLDGRDAGVGWLQVDEGDDDPSRFWAYVAAALADTVPGLPEAIAIVDRRRTRCGGQQRREPDRRTRR